MIAVLRALEPRHFAKGESILRDLDEVEEILFVQKGEYQVGYTVNNNEYFALKLKERTVVGDIAVIFRKRSEFLFKATTDIDG